MKKPIRVLQLFYTFDVEIGGGGLSLFAIELGKRLNPLKFEVVFCSLGYYETSLGKDRIIRLNEQGYQAFEATSWDDDHPYKSFANSYFYLNQKYRSKPFDIIHSHSEYTDVTAILLKLSQQAKYILRTVHYGFQYEWSTKPLRRAFLTNFTYPIFFDIEVGINSPITTRLNNRTIARLNRKKAIHIPNAISFERFSAIKDDPIQKRISLGIPPEAYVVGTVGRLAKQKGYKFLIDAAALILKEYPNVYFLIVGDGPLAEELNQQALSLGIADNIVFTGGRPDVEEILPCMDLFASSSLWEGLPTVLLEAMAAKVAIVATDIPGTNELIKHNVNGWLVNHHDANAIREGILRVMNTPSLKNKLVESAGNTLKDYSIDHIAEQYESLYDQMSTNKL